MVLCDYSGTIYLLLIFPMACCKWALKYLEYGEIAIRGDMVAYAGVTVSASEKLNPFKFVIVAHILAQGIEPKFMNSPAWCGLIQLFSTITLANFISD